MYYIYKITNLINGKTYIGQHKYKKLDDNYMGSGKLLKQAFKKYGVGNFTKEVLYCNIQYKETADDVERFAIAKEKAIGKAEYNIADGGQGGNLGEDVIKKMAKTRKGQTSGFKGKHHTEEAKRKNSEAHTGKKHGPRSEEVRKKISEANIGKNTWTKGRHQSKGTRKKLSELNKCENNPAFGEHWYNNGKISIRAKECPPGFIPGRL